MANKPGRHGQYAARGELVNFEGMPSTCRVCDDYNLPEDLERATGSSRPRSPQYWRSGLAQAPFDAERVTFGAALEKLASRESGVRNRLGEPDRRAGRVAFGGGDRWPDHAVKLTGSECLELVNA